MNERHPHRDMEREFVTTDISIRELCRRHGISSHSVVVDQAKKHDWAAKREPTRARESESFMEKHADRMADLQAEIHDKILDTIDEAVTKFRDDLRATKSARQPDGSVREEPAWYMKVSDLRLLIDYVEVSFGRPSVISQHQGPTVTLEPSVDALREFIEATRGRAGPSPMEESPLPRTRRLDD